MFYTNTTLFKNFRFKERESIQARWEVFNLFNHPNFQLQNRNFNETDAGMISKVRGREEAALARCSCADIRLLIEVSALLVFITISNAVIYNGLWITFLAEIRHAAGVFLIE